MWPGKSESDSRYDGPLSTYPEWHAFQHGLYDSFRSVKPKAPALPDIEDVNAEPHYYKVGWLIGTVLHLGLMAVAIGLIR